MAKGREGEEDEKEKENGNKSKDREIMGDISQVGKQ